MSLFTAPVPPALIRLARPGVTGCAAVLRNHRGSTTIEYALVGAMLALAAMIGLAPFGQSLAQEFSAMSHLPSLSADPAGGCPRVNWPGLEGGTGTAHLPSVDAHHP